MSFRMNITDGQVIKMNYESYNFDYGSYDFYYKHTMDGKSAVKLLSSALNLFRENEYKIELSKDKIRARGEAEHFSNNTFDHKINATEIMNNIHKDFSMDEALAPFVACFHEVCGHEWQWKIESQKRAPLSAALIMSDLACKTSYAYYGLDENLEPTRRYYNQLHELAAQYMGVKQATKYLGTIYGKEQAEDMMLAYVNMRVDKDTEYIEAPAEWKPVLPEDGRIKFGMYPKVFTSMEQVYDRFREAFIQQALDEPDYRIEKPMEQVVEKYLKEHGLPWERPRMVRNLNETDNNLSHNKAVSSVWVTENPNWGWVKDIPSMEQAEFPADIKQPVTFTQPSREDLDLNNLSEKELAEFTAGVESIRDGPGTSL